MSEKIEFIPAKDLPVAEGDEVDVLCVENGELKRKEGTSLGGSNNYDLVVEHRYTYMGSVTTFNVVTGSYETILEKLRNGNEVTGLLKYSFGVNEGENTSFGTERIFSFNAFPEENCIRFSSTLAQNNCVLCPDNKVYFEGDQP